MAIYLIVGQPRHGKSQFAVSKAHEYHVNNLRIQKKKESGKALDPEKDLIRNVYSDIAGHVENCDYVQVAPQDWREVPEDSVIFMDEIHLRPEYCDSNGKMSQDQMIVDLTTHGHQNKDIYLMTQDPARLNKGIHKLIEKMYLVKRPIQKPPFATIYEFERWLRDPWQAAASTRSVNYQDSYKFFYKKKWQDMYTSASAHTSVNFKIQRKFIYAIIAIFCLMSLSYFLFMKSGGDKLARTAVGGLTGQKPESQASEQPQETATGDITPIQNLDVECRKGANVEKPECVKWFNELSKSNGSVKSTDRMQTVAYNPNSPFDDADIVQNLSYEVSAKPVFSGCTHFNGQYTAYTQQGTRLKVSASDCKRLISDADRPFNYFAKEQPNKEPIKPETDKDEESSEYKKAFRENRARIDAEKMYLAQHAQVKPEPFDTNHVETKYLDSANRY